VIHPPPTRDAWDDVGSSTHDVVDPSTHDVVDPSTHDVVDPSTHDVVDPSTHDVVGICHVVALVEPQPPRSTSPPFSDSS
jgi:hypothetical protein